VPQRLNMSPTLSANALLDSITTPSVIDLVTPVGLDFSDPLSLSRMSATTSSGSHSYIVSTPHSNAGGVKLRRPNQPAPCAPSVFHVSERNAQPIQRISHQGAKLVTRPTNPAVDSALSALPIGVMPQDWHTLSQRTGIADANMAKREQELFNKQLQAGAQSSKPPVCRR
jgi:hypothetical protein